MSRNWSFSTWPLPKRIAAVSKETLRQFNEAQLLLVASSLAYTTILSIIPAIAVSFSIFKAFGGASQLYERIEPFIIENLAEGADDQALTAIRSFINNAHAGAIGTGGLIGLIVTTMSMLASIEKAINRIWRVEVERPLFQRITSYWFFVTLGPLGFSVALGAATSGAAPITQFLPSGTGIFLLTIGIFYLVYKYVPHCKVKWQPALLSAVVTAVLWNLARISYALYTEKAVTYDKIYGSLAAVPVLLLWIYIIWVIILSGAALTAGLQRRFSLE